MHRRHCAGGPARRHQPAAVASNAKRLAEQRLRGGCTERYEDLRIDGGKLGLEPRETGGDLQRIGLAVDAPGTARHPFEMLYRVGDVGLAALDARLDEAAVEQSSGRPDK